MKKKIAYPLHELRLEKWSLEWIPRSGTRVVMALQTKSYLLSRIKKQDKTINFSNRFNSHSFLYWNFYNIATISSTYSITNQNIVPLCFIESINLNEKKKEGWNPHMTQKEKNHIFLSSSFSHPHQAFSSSSLHQNWQQLWYLPYSIHLLDHIICDQPVYI